MDDTNSSQFNSSAFETTENVDKPASTDKTYSAFDVPSSFGKILNMQYLLLITLFNFSSSWIKWGQTAFWITIKHTVSPAIISWQ